MVEAQVAEEAAVRQSSSALAAVEAEAALAVSAEEVSAEEAVSEALEVAASAEEAEEANGSYLKSVTTQSEPILAGMKNSELRLGSSNVADFITRMNSVPSSVIKEAFFRTGAVDD